MIVLILFVTLFSTSLASKLTFTVTPDELKKNLTDEAFMRCSVDSSQTRGASSDVDVHRVVSIFVTHGGADVASVTGTDAAQGFVQHGGLAVKGDISGVSGEGYLELSWLDASSMALGEYTCDVTATDSRGHVVTMTSSIEVGAVASTIEDVIAAFKSKDEHQHQLILGLNQEVNKLKQCVSPHVGFTVTFRNTGTVSLANNQLAKYDNVLVNIGGGYDPTTGAFTCAIPGLYSFTVHVLGSGSRDAGLGLQLNGQVMASAFAENDDYNTASTSVVLELNQGDVVNVKAEYNSGFYQPEQSSHWGYQQNIFNGHLIQAAPCYQN